MLTEERIAELETMGFKRWTKGNYDRLYINARDCGLECTYYKTGNISGATWQGHEISHAEGYRLKGSKTFIDIKSGMLVSDHTWMVEAVAEMLGLTEQYTTGIRQLQIA